MRHVWILGSGGLLGGEMMNILSGEQGSSLFRESTPLPWLEKSALKEKLNEAMDAFAKRIDKNDTWELHWMAGKSIMSSTRSELEEETNILSFVLEAIASQVTMQATEGTIVFASSAGGVYAGSSDDSISESSAVSPLTPYGEEKLKQEEQIRSFASTHPNISVLISRLSTIYGPKQSQGKKQGLLTHIARSILRKKPVEIFVPLDTIRDYIHVRDAAAQMLLALAETRGTKHVVVKIVASEEPTTIAEIIRIFRHVLRIRPRIITSSDSRRSHYTRRICFRSTVLPEVRMKERTSLLCGIAEILASERLAMAKGK